MTSPPLAENRSASALMAACGMTLTPLEIAVFGPEPNLEEIEAFRYRTERVQKLVGQLYPQPKRRQRKPRQPAPDGLKTAAQAAAKLNISTKTLNGHVANGDLKYVVIGHGSKRQRKMFTDPDINEFIQAQTRKDELCPSDVTRAPRSGSTISKSEVVAFSARPRKPTSAKPK